MFITTTSEKFYSQALHGIQFRGPFLVALSGHGTSGRRRHHSWSAEVRVGNLRSRRKTLDAEFVVIKDPFSGSVVTYLSLSSCSPKCLIPSEYTPVFVQFLLTWRMIHSA